MPTYRLILGDSLEEIANLPDNSVDCVCSDPPYAAIKREYGWWTEQEWHRLMEQIIVQVRRVLKPTGSAVFIIQPNSETIGSMRPWVWEFIAKYAR